MNELIKTNSFGLERERIRIDNNIIEFNDRRFNLDRVSELKYGLEPIRLDMFRIGRKFVLELRNPEEDFKIILKSYLGFSRRYFTNIFSQIIDEIWKLTGSRLIGEAVDKIKNGERIQVGKCTITSDGVAFKNNFIGWGNLSYQTNYDKITLNNKSDYKIYTNLYYLDTYNFAVLIGVLDWIYKYDGLKEIEASCTTPVAK